MKIVTVTTGGPLCGDKCRHCKRTIRDGQVVFDQLVMDLPPHDQHFTVHARCMGKLVADAPPDQDVAAFDALRAEIIRTGDPFATVN